MTAEKTTMAFGWRVYGLGVMALDNRVLQSRSALLTGAAHFSSG
jgi:hypothetical protein